MVITSNAPFSNTVSIAAFISELVELKLPLCSSIVSFSNHCNESTSCGCEMRPRIILRHDDAQYI